MDYFLHLAIFICFYTLLAQSLNLIAGKAGLVSLVHAGFYGIGAYTTALLTLNFGFSFFLNLSIAILISGTIALLISIITLRVVDDYFIICTLALQVILFSLMNNWVDLTKGPMGIPGIPPIVFLGLNFDNKISIFLISMFFMLVVWWLLNNLFASGFGKILSAISEDEIYAQSIGKNVYLSKIIAFTLSAMLAVIPGSLYAHYISYIDPTSFTINESIFILSIVIIGGLGNLTGCFLSATFMIILPEILRFVGMPDSVAANIRQIILGIMLVVVMKLGEDGIKKLYIPQKDSV